MTEKLPPKSLSQVAENFDGVLTPSELEDILRAVKTLQDASGWGEIKLVYLNHEQDTIKIEISQKPRKKKEKEMV